MAFGGQDSFIPPEAIERIRSVVTAAGKPFEMHVYPEKNHGFFRQSSNDLQDPDVADVWGRVQTFLSRI